MRYTYGTTSKGRLNTCHPALQRLFLEAIRHRDISILCGHRGEEEQNASYDAVPRRSNLKWPDGAHNKLPSRAVDAGPWVGRIPWNDRDILMEFSGWVSGLAAAMNIPIRSGAFWTQPWDPLHFELVE